MPRRAGGTRQCGVERYSTPHCCVPPRCGAALTCAFGAFQAASALLWGSRAAAGSWALRLCGRWRRRYACSGAKRACCRWYATGRDRPVVPPPSEPHPRLHPPSLSVFCSRTTSAASTQTDRLCESVCLCVCVSVCQCVCVSVCLCVCLSACLSVCLSVYLPICTALLLQQDHNALAPGRRARSKEGHAEERKAAHDRRDRLQEGGARGAYGHRWPCTFNQHLLRTVQDTRARTLMRSPQLQGRHPVPCHANQGAHRHRLVLLGTEARDRSLNLYDDPRARRRAAGRLS